LEEAYSCHSRGACIKNKRYVFRIDAAQAKCRNWQLVASLPEIFQTERRAVTQFGLCRIYRAKKNVIRAVCCRPRGLLFGMSRHPDEEAFG